MVCQGAELIQDNVSELVRKEKYGKKQDLKSNLTKFYGSDNYLAMYMAHLIPISHVSWTSKKNNQKI